MLLALHIWAYLHHLFHWSPWLLSWWVSPAKILPDMFLFKVVGGGSCLLPWWMNIWGLFVCSDRRVNCNIGWVWQPFIPHRNSLCHFIPNTGILCQWQVTHSTNKAHSPYWSSHCTWYSGQLGFSVVKNSCCLTFHCQLLCHEGRLLRKGWGYFSLIILYKNLMNLDGLWKYHVLIDQD